MSETRTGYGSTATLIVYGPDGAVQVCRDCAKPAAAKPAAATTNAGALSGGPDRWENYCTEHNPIAFHCACCSRTPHLCSHGQPCEGS